MKQPSEPFPTLVSQLADPDGQMRRLAITEIMRRKSERGLAFASLVALLKDPDPKVCQAIITALGKLGDGRAISALVQISAQHSRVRFRSLALKALVQIDSKQAQPFVIKALTDPSHFVRCTAAEIVGQQRYLQAALSLVSLLRDADYNVLRTAVWALNQLGREGTDEVIEQIADRLIALLSDEVPRVREGAAEVVGGLRFAGGAEIVDGLRFAGVVEALLPLLGDVDLWVRRNAASALGELRDKRAVEPLIAALGDVELFVRGSAASALGNLGDKRAVDALITALGDVNEQVRNRAASALGSLGDPRAVDALITALGDVDGQVREAAAWALGSLGDSQAVATLTSALNDPYFRVQEAASSALNMLAQT